MKVPVSTWFLTTATLLLGVVTAAPAEPPAGDAPARLPLASGWEIRSSAMVDAGGEVVSTERFVPDGWHSTSIPSTVLAALVRNGVYPDPRVGLNNLRIPDASDEFNQQHNLARFSHLPDGRNPWKDPYWYRREFTLGDAARGRRVWLNFQAINYRADVWLNGRQIADRNHMVGALRRFKFDVTGAVRPGKNCLAVLVYPPDHPGVPDTQLDVFGRVRHYIKDNMRDVSLPMFIGYDCMPTVRDRQMGLWQEVYLEFTPAVDVRDPFIVTDLPLPKTDTAYLTVTAELVNASAVPQKGVLKGIIQEDGTTFEKEVTLGPGETKTVTFSAEDGPQPVIRNPRLWWPHNYGPQNLYHLRLAFEADGEVSDAENVTFGVREITRELYALDGEHGLRLNINGKKIFCQGGYIQPEILFEWDAARMDTEVRYFTEANLNLVFFEDIGNPPEAFLEACDRRGLLFGNCFFGCYWMTPGNPYPEDVGLVEPSTVDVIKRYRNHPSLWLYMAMNEGDTRKDVYEIWRRQVNELDGTRVRIPSGSFPDYRKNPPEWIKQDMPVGMNDWIRGKSYGWQEPAQYFRWVRDERGWMFMLEVGSASLPPVDSLRRFIPDLFDAPPGPAFPLTPTWAHHGANSYYKPYDAALRRLHGEPESVEDYCAKGHLVTADQHRAIFEATNHRMWTITSGLTQWKINACWPSVQWQIFDWYLRPMVSYYTIKKACAPLHVQLCPLDGVVSVVNKSLKAQSGLEVRARLFDFDMKPRWEKLAPLDVEANTVEEAFAVETPPDVTPVYFVKLELFDRDGNLVSDNFYWLSSRTPATFHELADLPPVTLEASYEVEDQGSKRLLRGRIHNPTGHLALCVHAVATAGPHGEEILPVFWNDNYFSLLPGETKELTAELPAADAGEEAPVLEVGGWNVRSPFDCVRLEASKTTVAPNEPFVVTATIADTFLDGSLVELLVDGKPVQTKRLWARGDTRRELPFRLTLHEPGTHEIRVGGRTVEVGVK